MIQDGESLAQVLCQNDVSSKNFRKLNLSINLEIVVPGRTFLYPVTRRHPSMRRVNVATATKVKLVRSGFEAMRNGSQLTNASKYPVAEDCREREDADDV